MCLNAVETRDYLVTDCSYTVQCLQIWKQKYDIQCQQMNALTFLDWVMKRYKGNSFRRKVVMASLVGLVYKIWTSRNIVVWNSKCEPPSTSMRHTVDTVRIRVQDLTPEASGTVMLCGFVTDLSIIFCIAFSVSCLCTSL